MKMIASSALSLSFLRKLVVGAGLIAAPAASFGSVFMSVNFAPPPLPIYTQPLCPGQGYLWTPGYWAYDDFEGGYFWVPGTWVEPPQFGYLWTPAYWGYGENAYFFHPGYWGPHIGFYGGVNYGFGYGGRGYDGGYWEGNRFNYNRSVNNINVTNIQNTYVKNVTVVNNYNNVSYNGGQGGVQARPITQELHAQHEQHLQPTVNQQQHQQLAAFNKAQFATVNGGRPPVVTVRTPEDFKQTVQRGGFGQAGSVSTSLPQGRQSDDASQGGSHQSNDPRQSKLAQPLYADRHTLNAGPNIPSRSQAATSILQPTPTSPQQAQRPLYQPPMQQARPQSQQLPMQQQRPMDQPPQQQARPQYQPPYQPQPRPQPQSQPRPQMQEQRQAPSAAMQRPEASRVQEQHTGGGDNRPRR